MLTLKKYITFIYGKNIVSIVSNNYAIVAIIREITTITSRNHRPDNNIFCLSTEAHLIMRRDTMSYLDNEFLNKYKKIKIKKCINIFFYL
jgi:hypothetical protein